MQPRTPFDQLISLAFSLYSTPGSYACVLGAGVSIPSGVPSAWGVQEELLQKLASIEGETASDPFAWYETKYGELPSYEGVLERLAPSQNERQQLLRGFFEPSEVERELQHKKPTQAHRAIARLVAGGALRVILTLNFDRLMETALRDEGVEPVVVSYPSDIDGLPPVHTMQALVVHLHGDYLNPTAMLNTKTELSTYPKNVDAFLDRITFDHGLLLVGWSAAYDPALVRALSRSSRRIYTPYWVEPGELSAIANELRSSIDAVKITSDADTALGRLADAVDALRDRESRDPLVAATAVGTAKRFLSGRTTAIGLHDHLQQEFDRLHQHKDLLLSQTGTESTDGGYDGMLARVEEATVVSSALIATAAYWGSAKTDQWWKREIARFAIETRGSGDPQVRRLQRVCALKFFYAAGVAASAAGRFDLVRDLLNLRVNDQNGRELGLCSLLAPEAVYGNRESAPGRRIYSTLSSLFVQHLAVGQRNFEDSWETFEFLRLVESTYGDPQSAQLIGLATAAEEQLNSAQERMDAADGGNDLDEHDGAQSALHRANQNHGRRIGSLADKVMVLRPYLTVQNLQIEVFRSATGQKLLNELARELDLHPLVRAGFGGGRSADLRALFSAVDVSIGRIGYDVAMASMPGRSGTVPDNFRIGDLSPAAS